MCKALIIGAGGVGTVVTQKIAANPVFTDVMLASRTKSKCDAVAAAIGGNRVKTAEVDADTLQPQQAQQLPLPGATQNRPFRVVASRSHLSAETQEFIDRLKAAHGEVDTVSAGSSLKLCLVAEGKADVYPRLAPTMEWDTAAGHAIARAAGCTVMQAGTTEPLHYNKENLLNPFFVVSRS